jgi:hypothetical protein
MCRQVARRGKRQPQRDLTEMLSERSHAQPPCDKRWRALTRIWAPAIPSWCYCSPGLQLTHTQSGVCSTAAQSPRQDGPVEQLRYACHRVKTSRITRKRRAVEVNCWHRRVAGGRTCRASLLVIVEQVRALARRARPPHPPTAVPASPWSCAPADQRLAAGPLRQQEQQGATLLSGLRTAFLSADSS